jgi:hypothetical protein
MARHIDHPQASANITGQAESCIDSLVPTRDWLAGKEPLRKRSFCVNIDLSVGKAWLV